jgi:hypothetical protein
MYAPNHIHVALRNPVSVNGTCRSADEVFRLLCHLAQIDDELLLASMMPSFEEPRASSYPRPPWDLKGTACLSIWRVPADDVPVSGPGIRPATLFGQCLVGTAWARYEPGGTLAYKELAAATAGLVGLRPVITIHDIWVDKTVAVLAGRELWGIPKQFARFDVRPNAVFEATAESDGQAIAAVRFASRFVLPGRWAFRLAVAQPCADRPKVTRARLRGRVELGRAFWTFAPDGPLAWLAGRRPLVSVRLSLMTLRFGH